MIGNSRQKGSTSAEGEQSWRELAVQRQTRVNSSLSWKRRKVRWIKFFGIILVCAIVVGAIIRAFQGQKPDDDLAATASKAGFIQRIELYTDGVLSDEWLSETIQLRPGISIMEVDIHALKETLEANAQVKSASVERVFPSEIHIDIIERKPVMRLMIANANGGRNLRLVARDGVVYEGIGYSATALKQLPFLQPYRKPDGSYFPLRGMESVAQLLDLVRSHQPDLFRTWQVVSLENYTGNQNLPGQVIEVRSKIVPEIVFSATTDYALQLDRLVYLLNYLKKKGNPSLERIDLSLRDSAAVKLSSGRSHLL